MIYAFKKQGESNERLISRFKQIVQRSRILLKAKKERFHVDTPTKKQIREAAVIRAKHRARRAKEQFYA
jgi:ribosomal protein S21